MASTSRWGLPTWTVLVAGGLGAGAVAWTTRPTIAADDAAITFRYAERLATGSGLTYNDGEHVLGASSGLHTLLLAAGRGLGLSVTSTAVVLGVVGMAVCTALIGLIAARLGGRGSAVVAMFLFVAAPVRWHATGGLESTTLLACCLAAVVAVQARRERLAGLALGIALVAKLDAGALLVSIVGASLMVRRRVPVRTLLWAAVAAAPWFIWVTWQYGNPLPQSLLSKASGRADAPDAGYDPTWALRRIQAAVPAALGAVAVAVGRGDDPDGRETRLVLVGWLLVGGAAVSLLPLGAPYPWYVAPLYAPIAVLAGDAVGWARQAIRIGSPSRAIVAVPVVLIAVSVVLGLRTVAVDLTAADEAGGAMAQWEDFREAGRYIERNHAGEVVQTCFGWTAFAAPSVTIADPCAINSPWPPDVDAEVVVEVVDVVAGDGADPVAAAGWCEEARFDDAVRSGGRVAVVVSMTC